MNKNRFGKNLPLIGLFLGIIVLTLLFSILDWTIAYYPLTYFVSHLENSYHQWLSKNSLHNPLMLLVFAFLGGLVSSISPCKLSLLSVNLSYLGTQDLKSRRDVFMQVGAFILGVVIVLSLLGLVSSFAGAVIVQFKGFISVTVGIIIILMGLSLLEIIRLPLPQITWRLPISGPFGVGIAFALVSSPCTSPVLFSVLTAAAATGSQIQSILTMVSYALGNTVIIFFASMFVGFAKQSKILLKYSQAILLGGSGLLIVMGGYYLIDGLRWLVLVYGYRA